MNNNNTLYINFSEIIVHSNNNYKYNTNIYEYGRSEERV